MTEIYEEVFSWIRSEIETINGGKELFYKKIRQNWVNADDDLPLDKQLKFPTLTIIIKFI